MDITIIIITAVISTTVSATITALIGHYKTSRKKTKAIQDGLQSLLRAEIIRQHEKYTQRGDCPVYAKDALRREYDAYHALGGNGVVTDLYKDIISLPETPENPKNKKEV
jgi:diacylglycerol kinase family enzyme